MEPGDDPKLRELLREWRVPGAPRSLDERVLALSRPWWSFLLTGSIRIPIPVGLAIAVAILVMGSALWRRKPVEEAAPASVSLVEFRPVSDVNVRVIRQNEFR